MRSQAACGRTTKATTAVADAQGSSGVTHAWVSRAAELCRRHAPYQQRAVGYGSALHRHASFQLAVATGDTCGCATGHRRNHRVALRHTTACRDGVGVLTPMTSCWARSCSFDALPPHVLKMPRRVARQPASGGQLLMCPWPSLPPTVSTVGSARASFQPMSVAVRVVKAFKG